MPQKLYLFSCFMFCLGFVKVSSAQTPGPGGALNFTANNQYVQFSQQWPITGFPITVTAWINAQVPSGQPSSPIVSSINNTSGYAGFLLQLVNRNSNWKLGAMIGGGNGGFVDPNSRVKEVPFDKFNQWCHIAVVFNSIYSFDIYIDGVLMTGSTSGSANIINFGATGMPRIGYHYSSNGYQPSFRGKIDEVKVFTVAQNMAQIRSGMCQKSPSGTTGLVAYYKFDETTGTTTSNSAGTAVGTLYNATRQTSEAPIGDESAYFYPMTTTPTMQWVNSNADTLRIANIANLSGVQGIHLYTVNEPPNSLNGVTTNCGNTRYQGVFPVVTPGSNPNFQIQYRNAGNPGAISYYRNNNSNMLWTLSTITSVTNGFNWNTGGRKEFLTGTGPNTSFTSVGNSTTFQFTNTTVPGPSTPTYQWSFGDGATSLVTNPQHTYATQGTYYVCLTSTNTCGSSTFCDSVVVTCLASSQFTNTTNGTTANFTSLATGTGTLQYKWHFGDGDSSTLANPQHYYASAGTYQTCLTVTDNCGSSTYCDSITISCTGTSAYTYQQQTTTVINFSAASVGTGNLTYQWNFGNGAFSTLPNPVINFGQEGKFYVCLETTDTCGTSTFCDSVVVACGGLISNYSFVQNNLTVAFTNLSAGIGNVRYRWDFGDGSFSLNPNPTYTYQTEGTYQVCLEVMDTCGVRNTCFSIFVCEEPTANFIANNTQGFTFKFLPFTAGANNYLWNFGDGNFTTQTSPTYTYQQKGNYNVCLQVIDDCGDADTCILVLASLVGLDEDQLQNQTKIFPNPATDIIYVSEIPEAKNTRFEIYNTLGVAVFMGDIGNQETAINVAQLPQGTYFIRIENENFSEIQKFVIQR